MPQVFFFFLVSNISLWWFVRKEKKINFLSNQQRKLLLKIIYESFTSKDFQVRYIPLSDQHTIYIHKSYRQSNISNENRSFSLRPFFRSAGHPNSCQMKIQIGKIINIKLTGKTKRRWQLLSTTANSLKFGRLFSYLLCNRTTEFRFPFR